MHHRRSYAVVATACFWVGVAYMIDHALADGVPSKDALTYSGVLEAADGAKIEGTHNIEVSLWLEEQGGTNPLCTTRSHALELRAGRFSASLPNGCRDAMASHADTWVEVAFNGSPIGKRSKIGVVPYALEAGHATTATSATSAAGALDDRINQLSARLDSLVQTGMVGASVETPGWTLNTGGGVRSYSTRVDFPKRLSTTPVVTVSLSTLDVDSGPNTRVEVSAADVSADGFQMVLSAWGDTVVYGATASWTAVAQ